MEIGIKILIKYFYMEVGKEKTFASLRRRRLKIILKKNFINFGQRTEPGVIDLSLREEKEKCPALH